MKTKLVLITALVLAAMLFCLGASAEGHTQTEAVAWANARLSEGWQLDYDGINGCQDIDLVKAYFAYLGVNRIYGYGYAYVNAILPSGWTRSSIPQAGDIAVWDSNSGGASQYGHVGIVTNVSGSNITYVATNDGAIQCTQHTVSRYNPTCYIHPIYDSYSTLDLNWRIDGKDVDGSQSAATVDVYVNGTKVADDVSDYYAEHKTGLSYEITDIKTKNGYNYKGVVSGQLKGTVNGNVVVRMMFDKSSAPVSGATVIITGSSVPVRNNPNTKATILGYASKNDVFSYRGYTSTDSRGVDWYSVTYYGQNGWVSSKLSDLKEDASSYSSGDSVKVINGNTNVRQDPNLSGKILGVAYKGSVWTYLGVSSVDARGITWYLISYKGSTAWISSKYTELSHDSSSDWSTVPGIKSVTQSAYLVSNNPVVDGVKAFDGNTSTCWCVSEYNYSFGQWVEVTYDYNRTVSGFKIINGYNKTKGSTDYWKLNSRVSTVAVYCDGSYVGTYSLKDQRAWQTVSFGWSVTGKTFRFVIRGAYAGTKYADVCISEIEMY